MSADNAPVDRDKLINNLKVEPADQDVLAEMEAIDDVDYEIFSERLRIILDEGRDVFVRCGVSQFAVAGDLAIGIYTPKGDLVDANAGAYLHVVTGIPPLKYIIENFQGNPTVGVEPGDVFYANDALYGGIHNPDQIAYMPIFHEGEIMAWVSAALHTSETGAIDPGGMIITAETRYDEGMRLSPIKIGEDFQLRDDMIEMQKNFVSRAPRTHEIDLRARLTAIDRVRRRVKELIIDERGPGFLKGLLRRNIEVARGGTEERLSEWNDGTYQTVHFFDSIGLHEGLWRLYATMRKEGSELTLDYEGTSPENEGALNAHPVAAIAHTANFLFSVPFSDLPKSNGTYDPIDFQIPKGTVYYPDEEAATVQSVLASSLQMSATTDLMSRMIFDSDDRDRVCAPYGNAGSGYAFAGENQWGVGFGDVLSQGLNTEGTGGRVDRDGVDEAVFPWCPFGKASDIEFVEDEYPFMTFRYRHWQDSCGHGKHRGGIGAQLAYMVHHNGMMFNSHGSLSRIHSSHGLFGGYSPNVMPGIVITDNDVKERMANGDYVPDDVIEWVNDQPTDGNYEFSRNSRHARPYAPGDVFIAFTSGGGGYGDALQRDPDAVVKDVRNERISEWAADNVYHVEYDEGSYTVDEEATEEARDSFREQRLEESVPFDDFIEEWETEQPDEEILKYYGSWPDAEPDRPIVRM